MASTSHHEDHEDTHIHVTVHVPPDPRLDDIIRLLNRIDRKENRIMADLTALTTEVSENADAVDSAVVLIGGLAQQIRDLATDPAALQALADELDSKTNELSAAVAANTPAAPDSTPPVA